MNPTIKPNFNNLNQQPAGYMWCDENNYIYKELSHYLDKKFQKHSRLLVIRLDLSFIEGSRGQWNAYCARDQFKRFMNNRRMIGLIDNEVGFAWTLEFGKDKGFHYHLILLFNGARSQQDQKIGHAIGTYWMNDINNGLGTYYCSNDDKTMFQAKGQLGIGMIHRHDETARANLLSIASYLAKDDPLIKPMLPSDGGRFRTFGKGAVRKST